MGPLMERVLSRRELLGPKFPCPKSWRHDLAGMSVQVQHPLADPRSEPLRGYSAMPRASRTAPPMGVSGLCSGGPWGTMRL